MSFMQTFIRFVLVISIPTLVGFSKTTQIQNINSIKKPIQLFNGKNLAGWQHVGAGNFVIENSYLKTQGGLGLLWYTKRKFGNVHIRIIYKTTYPEANSGVFVRIGNKPKTPWDAVHQGYEIQICDKGKDAFDAYHRTGAIYSLSKSTSFASKPPGEWNQYDIKLQNEKIVIWLNGKKINEFDFKGPIPPRKQYFEPKRGPRPLYGYIGIQNHDHNAQQKDSHVYFKEISIWPLDHA